MHWWTWLVIGLGFYILTDFILEKTKGKKGVIWLSIRGISWVIFGAGIRHTIAFRICT